MLKMDINTKEDLLKVITDLQGQMSNMQETIDKLSPVEEEATEEVAEEKEEDDLSDEEISEIDKLLQES